MAEYQEITDSEVQPEAPLTSALGVRFRDNPIALAQGAAGAPRIQTAALNNSAVTTAKINNSAVTTAKISNGNVTAAKINIQQRSFSGGLSGGSSTTVSISDVNPLYPRLTISDSDQIAMGGESSPGTGSRLRVTNTSTTTAIRDYAVAWGYIV